MTFQQLILVALVAGLGLVLLLLFWIFLIYNRLVKNRNRLREAWSGIDVQLKRRHDLVPALVATVKGVRDHERDLLEEVARLRGEAVDAATSARTASDPEEKLGAGIGRIFALAESYPELAADDSFRELHASLVEIEDDLQYARRYYNGSVRDLNNLVEGFPSGLVASRAGFRKGDFFEVGSAAERIPPAVHELLADRQ